MCTSFHHNIIEIGLILHISFTPMAPLACGPNGQLNTTLPGTIHTQNPSDTGYAPGTKLDLYKACRSEASNITRSSQAKLAWIFVVILAVLFLVAFSELIKADKRKKWYSRAAQIEDQLPSMFGVASREWHTQDDGHDWVELSENP